jgi:hypothetical protein
MLTLPAMILIGVGLLLCLIGGVWGIVVAFRRSLLWGLCYLFVPFAALVFLVVAWADAKRSFFVSTIGTLVMASVLLLPGQGGLALNKKIPFELDQLAPSPAVVPGAIVQVSNQDPLVELAAREQVLRGRKAALDPHDAAAARALTDDILKYNADLKAATERKSGGAVAVSDNPAPK